MIITKALKTCIILQIFFSGVYLNIWYCLWVSQPHYAAPSLAVPLSVAGAGGVFPPEAVQNAALVQFPFKIEIRISKYIFLTFPLTYVVIEEFSVWRPLGEYEPLLEGVDGPRAELQSAAVAGLNAVLEVKLLYGVNEPEK